MDRIFYVYEKNVPSGLSAHALGLYTLYIFSETAWPIKVKLHAEHR